MLRSHLSWRGAPGVTVGHRGTEQEQHVGALLEVDHLHTRPLVDVGLCLDRDAFPEIGQACAR